MAKVCLVKRLLGVRASEKGKFLLSCQLLRFEGLLQRLPDRTGLVLLAVLVEAATLPEVDIVVNAVVGAAGLDATLAALRAGKKLATNVRPTEMTMAAIANSHIGHTRMPANCGPSTKAKIEPST